MYAPNAVLNMLNGKAIARAVRTHCIVDAALNALMLTNVLNALLQIQPNKSNSNAIVEGATMLPDDLSDEVSYNLDLDGARVA